MNGTIIHCIEYVDRLLQFSINGWFTAFPIMLVLCLMLSVTHYAQNYTGMIGGSLILPIYNFSLYSPSLWGLGLHKEQLYIGSHLLYLVILLMHAHLLETSCISGYHALLSINMDYDCTRTVSFFIKYLYNVIRKKICFIN